MIRINRFEICFFFLFLISIATFAGGCDSGGESNEDLTIDFSELEKFDPAPDGDGPGVLCPEGSDDLFNNSHSPYFGGTDSVDLEVVGISYFGCPHCADLARTVKSLWAGRPEYQKRVRFYFRHFPFNYQTAWEIHGAAVAAANQGHEHFWVMHDYIFEKLGYRAGVDQAELVSFARDTLKLDMNKFEWDMESNDTFSFLNWDKGQAAQLGIDATPAVFVCGKKIDRFQLEQKIDEYLNINAPDKTKNNSSDL